MTYINKEYQWVSIPKCASQTISRVLESKGWEAQGFHKVYDAEKGGRCVALIRDPFDRLTSACSFLGIPDIKTLSRYLDYVETSDVRGLPRSFFSTQASYLGPDPILYPFENLQGFLCEIAVYNGPHTPMLNRRVKRLTSSFIRKSSLASRIYSKFQVDFNLRETLQCPIK